MIFVGFRIRPKDHKRAMRMAKREGVSFGKFVRISVNDKVDALKDWEPTGDGKGFMDLSTRED